MLLDGQWPLAVFTGDTLFYCGCGKFFEGSAEEMHSSLSKLKRTLCDSTTVFVGHNYTATNLLFSLKVDPNNICLQERKLEFDQNGQRLLSINWKTEMETNPFLNYSNPSMIQSLGSKSPIDALSKLRHLKNIFK